MGRPRKHPRKWYIAQETFVTVDSDGVPTNVKRNETRVPEGHWLLRDYKGFFRPIDADGPPDIESATAVPGERRGE